MGTKKDVSSKVIKEGEFVPPDGGWGWMIIVAAGFSNLSTLPMFQQFGLLFRDKFARLGMSSSQTTTIINMNAAMASCVGLANGPLFRKFTYRKVSLTGATVVFFALIMTAFSYNFITYLIFFSILYGAGYGISSSANALALNTYWKERRRLATGLSWTATGLGPIIWPQVIALAVSYYGEDGAILLISGFSLHAIACSFLLHPVKWHEKNKEEIIVSAEEQTLIDTAKPLGDKDRESGYFSSLSKIKNLSVFSSQYLYNEDDPNNPGYEITDPGVPMMLRANDGYYSQSRQTKSRISSREGSAKTSRMNSKKPSMTNLTENRSRKSSTLYLNESKKNSYANLSVAAQEREPYKGKSKNTNALEPQIPESEIEDCPTLKAPQDLKADEKEVVENIDPEKAKYIADRAQKHTAVSKSLKSFKMDGQYSEKYGRDNHSNISLKTQDENINDERKYNKDNHSNQSIRGKYRRKSNNFNYENEVLKLASLKLEEYLKENETQAQYDKIKLLINGEINEDDDDYDQVCESKVTNGEAEKNCEDENDDEKLTFCQKLAIFFDLDLLKDFTFINLMVGITLAGFSELNFSILTPFIFGDFGLSKELTAVFMSILAGVDISVRFAVPFVAGKIGWDNNSFFLFGVLTMAFGRVVLSLNQSFSVIIAVAVIIGFGKGLRTVFMALVIPTYVPLHKLPGASGIQLLTSGVVYLILGPMVGWIKDHAAVTTTLHCLNIFTYLTALSWGLEKYYNSRKQKKNNEPPPDV